jgi:chorismate mutase
MFKADTISDNHFEQLDKTVKQLTAALATANQLSNSDHVAVTSTIKHIEMAISELLMARGTIRTTYEFEPLMSAWRS